MSDTTVSYTDLSSIVRTVNQIGQNLVTVDRHVAEVYQNMGVLKNDLETLKHNFVQMMDENRRQAALQRALTEIIRVRQELERDFGNYKLVRNTMLGILEATDLQLVRETTLTKCTEELMLSTPRYWLAPVLIALSAWISDNKPLATRALKEALRRDEEKTCLTLALICRRNKRTQACFEWLSRYFAKQKADDMKESIIAYIDAYTNGVFGEDRDNLCEEYIVNWMNELQSKDENFAQKQITYWKGVYQTYCKTSAAQYPKLAECAAAEFPRMDAYISRINAAPEIISFFARILETEVDQQALIVAIDNELIKLVTNYDKDEAPLREEEDYLTDIKNSNGNEKWARARRELRRASRIDRQVNLAERLSETITSNRTEDISAKKTAIRFMQEHIKGAFREFMEEKAPAYPHEITIHTHNWSGKAHDDSNRAELLSSYEKEINRRREEKLAQITNKKMITFFVLMAICLVAGIVGFICYFAADLPAMIALGIIGLLAGIAFLLLALNTKKQNTNARNSINAEHDGFIRAGKNDINETIDELLKIHTLADTFSAEESCEKLFLTEGEENA